MKLSPGDGEAEDLMKRASVAVAMNKGKWEQSEDFRTQLKDEAEAQSLEQAAKTVTDSKSLEDLIRQTYVKSTKRNRKTSTTTDSLAIITKDTVIWRTPLLGFREARKQAGQSDVSLEEKERQLTLEYFDSAIDQWEKSFQENPNDESIRKSSKNPFQTKNNIRNISLNLLFNAIQRLWISL